jgi:plastocyanin
MKKTIGVFLLFACAGLALAVSVARPAAKDTTLDAVVGPGFSITLMQNGTRVTNLDPGDYTINVADKSTEHNFHLFGPGVDQTTAVDTESTATWHVTFQNGSYTYVCDAHVASMIGKFTVGGGGTTTTSPSPQPAPLRARAKVTALHRLLTATGTTSRRATITVSVWKGAKKLASKRGVGTKVVLKYTARSAGAYTAKVSAKAGTSTSAAAIGVVVK